MTGRSGEAAGKRPTWSWPGSVAAGGCSKLWPCCKAVGRLWPGNGKAGQACGGRSGGGVDIASASGEVGDGPAERQWSDSGPALEGSPAVARLWECNQGEARLRGSGEAPRVPGECARESAPGECALGECARGSVPGECASARVTEECCVLGECLRVCPVHRRRECARGVCPGSVPGECGGGVCQGVRWGSVPGECVRWS